MLRMQLMLLLRNYTARQHVKHKRLHCSTAVLNLYKNRSAVADQKRQIKPRMSIFNGQPRMKRKPAVRSSNAVTLCRDSFTYTAFPLHRKQKYTPELLKHTGWYRSDGNIGDGNKQREWNRRRAKPKELYGHIASSETANECIKHNHDFRLSRSLHRHCTPR